MKTRNRFFSSNKMVLSVVTLFAFFCNSFAEDVLVFHADFDYAPTKWIENGEYKGLDVDVVTEACRRARIKPAFVNQPWQRILLLLENGTIDAAFSAVWSEEREKFCFFVKEQPIRYSRIVIFARKGEEFKYNALEDLYGKKIGLRRGDVINKDFDKAVADKLLQIEEVAKSDLNFLKLKAKRIDVVVSNEIVGLYWMKKLGMKDDVVVLPGLLREEEGAYIVISKAIKNKDKFDIIERLNNALSGMKKDGTLEKIYDRYR